MDLLEHAAGVWARRFVLLAGALLVAVAVFGVRSAAPERYEATTTVQVRLPDTLVSDPASQAAFYADTSTGLVSSRSVVAQALELAGRDDDVDEVLDDVSASAGADPGFVEITAAGSSPQEAVGLAEAIRQVLIARVAADQATDLADQRTAVTDAIADLGRDRSQARADGLDPFEKAALDREREALLGSLRTLTDKTSWRLMVVEPAVAPTTPTSPTPTRDAVLALIVALILGAELIVLARAWRGSLSARDPGAGAGTVAGVPGLAVRPERAATSLSPLLPTLGAARTITVVQSGTTPQARTAGLLGELLAARGEVVALVDAGRGRPTVHRAYDVPLAPGLAELRGDDADRADLVDRLGGLPRVRNLAVLPAGELAPTGSERPLRDVLEAAPQGRVVVAVSIGSIADLVELAAEIAGPVVLDVEPTITKRCLRAEVEAVRGLGLDLVAVTVSL